MMAAPSFLEHQKIDNRKFTSQFLLKIQIHSEEYRYMEDHRCCQWIVSLKNKRFKKQTFEKAYFTERYVLPSKKKYHKRVKKKMHRPARRGCTVRPFGVTG